MEIRLKVTDNMSKEEEIAIVDRLQQVFNKCPDNYLRSFFTPSLQSFLTNAIRDDISPTVDHFINGSVQFEKDAEISKLRKELDSLRGLADDNLDLAERARQAEAREKDRVMDILEQLNDCHTREEDMERDKQYDEVIIRGLKAEIYDLERRK